MKGLITTTALIGPLNVRRQGVNRRSGLGAGEPDSLPSDLAGLFLVILPAHSQS